MYLNTNLINAIQEDKYLLFDALGFFGPIILFIIDIIYLLNQPLYLYLYICLFFVNSLINKGLKIWIQQSRPLNGKSFIGETYENMDIYGMPSGHAQSTFFSLTYLFLVKKNIYVLICSLFLACLTVLQRFKYRNHTSLQLFIGSGLGICVAYLSILATQFIIK